MTDWMPLETARAAGVMDGRDVLLYGSYLYPGDSDVTEYWMVGSYCGRNGPGQRNEGGWETHEGVHADGFFSHWQPLSSPLTTTVKQSP